MYLSQFPIIMSLRINYLDMKSNLELSMTIIKDWKINMQIPGRLFMI